jgi:hypothetical protein
MSGVADSIEIGVGITLAARVDKPVLVGGRCETASMADASATGAGDAVPTALDRFLAAGIS